MWVQILHTRHQIPRQFIQHHLTQQSSDFHGHVKENSSSATNALLPIVVIDMMSQVSDEK
jgi:hypothetical protein